MVLVAICINKYWCSDLIKQPPGYYLLYKSRCFVCRHKDESLAHSLYIFIH